MSQEQPLTVASKNEPPAPGPASDDPINMQPITGVSLAIQDSKAPTVADASMNSPSSKKTDAEPTDNAVITYLRKHGLVTAALELEKALKEPKAEPLSNREQMELDDAETKNRKSMLAKITGGGYGYDLEGAPYIPQWGVPDCRDESEGQSLADKLGQDEARAYLDSYTSFQLWVMSLPDDPSMIQPAVTVVAKEGHGISIASIVKRAAGEATVPENVKNDAESIGNDPMPWLPPSTKPELLAVAFALFVNTYCELLEVGMESTAETLLETFRSVYEPLYSKELLDLESCRTTKEIVRLNSHNSQHLDVVSTLKAIMLQVENFQHKKEELSQDTTIQVSSTTSSTAAAKKKKLAEYDQNITLLRQKYQEMSKRATTNFDMMQAFPFLRRARAVRWHLSLSATTYGMLAAYLSSQESLLPMSTLLQTKCEIHVERRDPLPYTPACILDDNYTKDDKPSEEVRWAAPIPPAARLAESGEALDHPSKIKEFERLPFPRFHLDEEYDNPEEAAKAKMSVEFNRALLVNGFRRLEALERIRDYEVTVNASGNGTKSKSSLERERVADPLKPTIFLSTLCASSSPGPTLGSTPTRLGSSDASAIWEESGIGITCAKLCPPDGRRVAAGCDDAAIRIWSLFDFKAAKKEGAEEKVDGVSETAMVLLGHKNGFPVFDLDWNRDGRTLLSAGGDGSVRLWDTMAVGPFGDVAKVTRRTTPIASSSTDEGNGMTIPGLKPESFNDVSGAGLAVFRGHSPSCPIWSVAFAPSGYYFASAASDSTARIWTTDRPAPVRILTGHTSASVNTVTWHPNCNYVLTGSDDMTVRMWDIQTGRCVRLFNGCYQGVNVVRVCPSGRYAAGADYSGVVHIWDLGNGKKVNELRTPTELSSGSKRDAHGAPKIPTSSPTIHTMSYSACGTSLATGGDDCVVRVWDVRGAGSHMSNPDYAEHQGWGNAGPAIGTRSGDRPGTKVPSKSFPTKRTVLLDLQFSRRNLLLSVGRYTTAVPLVIPIAD